MNPIFSFFKFFWDDLKSDIVTIKKIFTEKGFFEQRLGVIIQAVKGLNMNDIMLYVFPLLLFMALAFFAGWYLAAVHYQSLCNQAIYNLQVPTKTVLNYTLGFS